MVITLVGEPVQELIQLGRSFDYKTIKEYRILPIKVLNRKSYFGYVDLVWLKKLHPIKKNVPVVGFEVHNISRSFNTEQAKKNATTLACLSPSLPVIFFKIDPSHPKYGDRMRWAWQGYEKIKNVFGDISTLSDLEYWTWGEDYKAIVRAKVTTPNSIRYEDIKTGQMSIRSI